MGGQEDLTKSLKAIMARKRDGLGEPPTPEELLAYRDGRLDPAERQRIADKIAFYPDAARALADLAAFPDVEPAPGTPELSEDEVGARWQAFRRRLEELPQHGGGEKPAGPTPASPARRGLRPWPFALKLAAALAGVAAVWTAGFLGGRASRDVPGSAINVNIAELMPVEEGGARSAAATLEMPEGSEELVLVLRTPAEEDFSGYEAEILDAEGARIWERQGLRPTEMGTFHLSFRRGVLPPGRLQVRLFGTDGKSRMPLVTYEVRLLPGVGPQ